MRWALPLLALASVTASCAGDEPPVVTASPRAAHALDYAASARRAILGTRFEVLADRDVADLIVGVCEDLESSRDPDATVLGAVASVEVPAGEPVDDEIFTIVVAEGVASVCPDEVQAASLRGEALTDPEGAFLAAAGPAAEGSGVGRAGLLAAGTEVCDVLGAGGSPEDAVLAEIALLFGVVGSSWADLSASGALGEHQALLAGTVLGAASSLLCPQHRDAVATYLAVLGS